MLLFVKFCWDSVVFSHLLSNFHHVKVLEGWAVFDAELEVSLLVSDGVAVKSKLCQLVGIFDGLDVFELFNSVVGQEDPLQTRALVQALHRLDHVSPEIDFSERYQPIESLHMRDEIVGQVKHPKLAEVVDIFNLGNLIAVQV